MELNSRPEMQFVIKYKQFLEMLKKSSKDKVMLLA